MVFFNGILIGIVVVFIGVFEWILPGLQRPDNLFSVTVAPDTRQRPEGRALIRRWRVSSLGKNVLFAGLGLVFALTGDLLTAIIVLAAVPLAVGLGEAVLYAIFHRQALAFAVPNTSAIHEATLVQRRYLDMVPLWWELGSCLIIGATISIIAALYPQLPDRYPIHWNLNGVANGFADKSPASAFALVWFQLGMAIFLTLIGISTTVARMQNGRDIMRQAMARYLFLVKIAIITIFGFIAVVTVVSGIQQTAPGYWILIGPLVMVGVILVAALVIFGRLGQSAWRVARSTRVGDGTPDSAWKLGLIYYNPQDPAWLVERRDGIGMTFNFARPQGWLILGGLVALGIVIPVVLTLSKR